MTDEVGRFLYEHGVPPDDFPLYREKAQREGLAIIKFTGGMCIYHGDEDRTINDKINQVVAACITEGTDFSVSFFRNQQATTN